MAHMGVADQKRTGKFTTSPTRVLEYLKQVLGLLPHVSMQKQDEQSMILPACPA